MAETGVVELVKALADEGSFTPWAQPGDPAAIAQAAGYGAELAAAVEATGNAESVIAGEMLVDGIRAALIASDFDFLAGSVGRAACQVVIAALDRAATLGLPVIASPASGGTRMQEGSAGFVLMADVAEAVERYRAAGGAFVVWLRSPTMGGVMATWGSLGTVTFAEPGALTGFLGPRVFEALHGSAFPPGVQTSENLAAHGVIDAVVPIAELRPTVGKILRVVASPSRSGTAIAPASVAASGSGLRDGVRDPWDSVTNSRDPRRPSARDLIARLGEVTQLHGTGMGERSDAVVLALALVGQVPAVVIAQDRHGGPLGPAALRTARRGFAIASALGLPLLTVIDTAGAELSREAEEAALSGEIARCLAELTTIKVPTVSLILGMGCGGGALALLPADRVLAAEQSWISPLPLEGASVIRFRTPERAAEMARTQKVDAPSLQEAGVVDELIVESPDAADDPVGFLDATLSHVEHELLSLLAQDQHARLDQRRQRHSGGLA